MCEAHKYRHVTVTYSCITITSDLITILIVVFLLYMVVYRCRIKVIDIDDLAAPEVDEADVTDAKAAGTRIVFQNAFCA